MNRSDRRGRQCLGKMFKHRVGFSLITIFRNTKISLPNEK